MSGPTPDRRHLVEGPGGPLEVFDWDGGGAGAVLLPSLGRGARDFDDLADRLRRAGRRALCPQPRGLGSSTTELSGLTLADLADDVAAVVSSLLGAPAVVVGHAFGNRVARLTATRHPDLVRAVALLACGGLVPPSPEAAEALLRVFGPTLSDEEHLAAVATAFFAPGNDPAVWREGWNAAVAAAQVAATRATPVETWWAGGAVPLLVIQPADDVMAVPANAHHLAATYPDRVTLVEVPDAGHALLPEQPETVARVLSSWLDGLDGLDRPASLDGQPG